MLPRPTMSIYNKEISWFRNTITNLYNAVSAPVATTRDALSERLQSVRENSTVLYYNFVREKKMFDYYNKRSYIEELEELEDMYMLDYYLWEHKENYGKALTQDLFRYYHQKMFSKALREELIPITWHPDRYWDWCVPEDEKERIRSMFC